MLNQREIIFKWIGTWFNNFIITQKLKLMRYILKFWINKLKVNICSKIIIQKLKFSYKNWNFFNMNKKKLTWIFKKMEKREKSRKISIMKKGWRIWRKRNKLWRKILLKNKKITSKGHRLFSKIIKENNRLWSKKKKENLWIWKRVMKSSWLKWNKSSNYD